MARGDRLTIAINLLIDKTPAVDNMVKNIPTILITKNFGGGFSLI